MSILFHHASELFKYQMQPEDLHEIKGSSKFVQVDNDKTPIRMSKKDALLRRKTSHIGQQHSKLARRLTDEKANSVSVNIFSLR